MGKHHLKPVNYTPSSFNPYHPYHFTPFRQNTSVNISLTDVEYFHPNTYIYATFTLLFIPLINLSSIPTNIPPPLLLLYLEKPIKIQNQIYPTNALSLKNLDPDIFTFTLPHSLSSSRLTPSNPLLITLVILGLSILRENLFTLALFTVVGRTYFVAHIKNQNHSFCLDSFLRMRKLSSILYW